MVNQSLCAVLLLLAVTSHGAAQCNKDTCRMPTCRCWNDPTSPGGLDAQDIPQMVLLSFAYAVNSANAPSYSSLFEDVENPNKCPARGTFFAQKLYSQPGSISKLFSEGHEIALTSADGNMPSNWDKSLKEVGLFLLDEAKIPEDKILGVRAPQLEMGGDDQFDAMTKEGLRYDSSCVSRDYATEESMLWPFTYDFADGTPLCNSGKTPNRNQKGVWEFTMPALELKDGTICATPSDCAPYLKTSLDVMDFLTHNFLKHYNGRRTPFVFEVNPQWMAQQYQIDGTQRFMQYIRGAFRDNAWIITHQQALAWITNPVPSDEAKTFQPWQCSNP